MKKIAIISPFHLPIPAVKGGGVETLIETIINLNEIYKQLEITVYSIYDEQAVIESQKYRKTDFQYIAVPKWQEQFYKLLRKQAQRIFNIKINPFHHFVNEVIKDMSDKKFDKVIIENNIDLVTPIGKKIKNDIYYHLHNDLYNDSKNYDKRIIDYSRRIITVSDYIKRRVLTIAEIKEEQVSVLRNCTDVNLFNREKYMEKRESLRNKYNIANHDIVIMFSGRISKSKGIKELLLAFKELPNRNNLKLLIVGSAWFGKNVKDSFFEELLEIAESIKENVIFTGFIPYKKLPEIHALSDIAVVPSKWEEPAGLVVLEAMASGLPLIVTDSGGIPEFICENCALIVKRDINLINNLKESLEKLISNDYLRRLIGWAGKEHAQQYNDVKYYHDFLEIIS